MKYKKASASGSSWSEVPYIRTSWQEFVILRVRGNGVIIMKFVILEVRGNVVRFSRFVKLGVTRVLILQVRGNGCRYIRISWQWVSLY